MVNVGKYTIPMDPMEYVDPVTGLELQWMIIFPKSSEQRITSKHQGVEQ